MTQTDRPIVCTLTTKEAASQVFGWETLHGHALQVGHIEDGAEMTLPLELGDSVEALAEREMDCCGSFLTIVTTRSSDELRLRITSSNPDALPVIHLLAGLKG